jgi:hypothetical protein
VAIVLGIAAFLLISFGVARWLTSEGSERNAILALLDDQARGDVTAVLARLPGCAQDPACADQARRAVARTKRPGDVKILNLTSPTSYALGDDAGRTRVAWAVVGEGNPVVQCVTVHREGNALFGRKIVLQRISLPIAGEGAC